MEAIVAAVGIVLIGLAAIFGAIFQGKQRGKAEGRAERHKDDLEAKDEIIDDVKLANAARDAASVDFGDGGSLRDNKYNRDKNPPE